MRIVVVADGHPTLSNAAQWAFVAARLRGYASEGHNVHCIVRNLGSDPIPIECYNLVQAADSKYAIDIIRKIAPDVVACHAPDPSSFSGEVAAEVVNALPTYLWIHGYESLYTAFYGYQKGWKIPLSILRDFVRLRRLRQVVNRASGVIYVSEWMKAAGQKGTGKPKCRSYVIPNPIDTELFKPQGEHIHKDKIRVIAVRGLNHKYGVDLAIRALAENHDAELTVIGSGPLKKQYEILAEQLNCPVHFYPSTFQPHELVNIYNDHDVFLAPSRAEAQGVAMCEAMSCGLPVIATRVGGIPEYVTDKYSGFLVSPERPDEIREAIRRFSGDRLLLKEMGLNAMHEMRNKCANDLVIRKELEVFKQKGNSPNCF
mgnify:FL=1